MRVAFGLKAHSGWAALVTLGHRGDPLDPLDDPDALHVVERSRLELVDASERSWARAPYHAAEQMEAGAARKLVRRGLELADRVAIRELGAALERTRAAGHEVAAVAVLAGASMPGWSVDEILAVHFRMHKAEGVMFREALARAALVARVAHVAVPEKQLDALAAKVTGKPATSLRRRLDALGKAAGPPWGKDQKDAALAAFLALSGPVE